MKHLFLLVVLLQCPAESGLFEGLKQTESLTAATPTPQQQAPETHTGDVPFEMAVADEKLMSERRQMNLSPLDICHSQEGQLELRELTSASLDKLLQGHSALQSQQGELWKGQEQLESSLSSNLKHLSQEKALIASGQELVAQLIQVITQRMENGTLVCHHLDNMQYRLEERLHIIQGYLGWAGLRLAAMWTCAIVHTIRHFLLCAVLLAILGWPLFTRFMLLLTVPLNAVALLNQHCISQDTKSLSRLLLTLSLGHCCVNQLLWAYTRLKVKPASLPPCEIVEAEKHDPTIDVDPLHQSEMNRMDPWHLICWIKTAVSIVCSRTLNVTFSKQRCRSPMTTPKFIGRLSQSTALMEDVYLRNLGSVFDADGEFRSPSPNQSLTSNGSLSLSAVQWHYKDWKGL